MNERSPSSRRLLLLAAVGLLLMALPACDLIVRRAAREPECRVNNDCGATALCFVGACVSDAALLASDIYAEVRPQAFLSFMPQQKFQFAAGRLPLRWEEPLGLSGNMRDQLSNLPRDGQLTLSRFERMALSDGSTFVVDRVLQQSVVVNRAGRFFASLQPGSYAMLFTPTVAATSSPSPPFAGGQLEVVSANQTVTITYPDDATVISGRLVDSLANPVPLGIAGAKVFAEVFRGSTRFTSTVATSDDDGFFRVTIGLTSGRFRLFVGPGSASESAGGGNPFVPSLVLDNTEGRRFELSVPPGDASVQGPVLGDVVLGAIGNPVDIPVRLVDADGLPVGNAAIIATGTIGAGSYRTGGLTRSDGSRTLPVVRIDTPTPIEYQLTFIPAAGAFARAVTTTVAVSPSGVIEPITVQTQRRVEVTGSVLDANDLPVTGALVSFVPTSFERCAPQQTRSDAAGRFTLRLDPCDYTVTAVPRIGERRARGFLEVTVGEAPLEVTLSLPVAALVAGEISALGAESTSDPAVEGPSFKGAAVDFYRVIGGKSVLVGTARVDASNHFNVALPGVVAPSGSRPD